MNIERMQHAAITDWYSLGAAIGVKANLLSWVLHERSNMQKRIRLGKRTVYRSDTYLRHIQRRLLTLLEPMFDALPDTKAVLAYRKGITATDVVRKVPHAKVLISFDIRHYYDSVTLQCLENCLVKMGFPRLGARLIGRYCVVQQQGRHTLQQGSPASPVLSNIVGHYVFDRVIENWLRSAYPDVQVTYLRYCDNIALFVHSEMPHDFSEKLKAFVKSSLAKQGFKTHKWATVADNHPVMHQKFLGMVINAEARVALDMVDRLRAMLLNWCRHGLEVETNVFLTSNNIRKTRNYVDHGIMQEKYKQHLRGNIQYVKRINRKQGLMLEKLYEAAKYLDVQRIMDNLSVVNLPAAVFAAVKKYRAAESVETYIDRVKNICLEAE